VHLSSLLLWAATSPSNISHLPSFFSAYDIPNLMTFSHVTFSLPLCYYPNQSAYIDQAPFHLLSRISSAHQIPALHNQTIHRYFPPTIRHSLLPQTWYRSHSMFLPPRAAHHDLRIYAKAMAPAYATTSLCKLQMSPAASVDGWRDYKVGDREKSSRASFQTTQNISLFIVCFFVRVLF